MRVLQILAVAFGFSTAALANSVIPVALLPPTNISGEAALDHWGSTLAFFLADKLGVAPSVRVIPDSTRRFARRELHPKAGGGLDPAQARQIAETMEARFIVWGTYGQSGTEFWLAVRVMNVRTGKTSPELRSASDVWSRVVSTTSETVLRTMGKEPTAAVKQSIERPITASSEAFELVSRAAFKGSHWSLVEEEGAYQRALSLDPDFTIAALDLAFNLDEQGKKTEGMAVAKRAVARDPACWRAHYTLGRLYTINRTEEGSAPEEFNRARRLAPWAPENLVGLADFYSTKRDWGNAAGALKKAEEIAPYDALVHAELGYVYAKMENREDALAQLESAERCGVDTDSGLQNALSQGYLLIGETARAVKCYERYLAVLREKSGDDSQLRQKQAYLAQLKQSLVLHFVSASRPQALSPSDFEAALHKRLTPAECKLVPRPLACTAEMNHWAQTVVGGAQEPIEVAKRLFEPMVHRSNQPTVMSWHSAVAAFKAWSGKKTGLTCEDYALLYVALARSVGLPAYFVTVERDLNGKAVVHACAGVFVEKQLLLIDPLYAGFGIVHKQYAVLNDLQVAALGLSEMDEVATRRVAVKLCPDWAPGHFNLACGLAEQGQLDEAHRELRAGTGLAADSWMASYVQGVVAAYEKNWKLAVEELKKSVAQNSDLPQGHYLLGLALQKQNQFEAARDEYQASLRGQTEASLTTAARRALAQINKALKARANVPTDQNHEERKAGVEGVKPPP